MSGTVAKLAALEAVHLGAAHHEQLTGHARRKLHGEHLAGETPERKAYGLLGGRIVGDRADVTHVFCLRRNLRYEQPYREEMDALLSNLAIASETPLERRGWVADPQEVLAAEHTCDAAGSVLFASYHMHRVAWQDDPLRDTCTAVDEALARASGLWVVIVSMVDSERPLLRAFFEGDNRREARVVIV